MGLFNIKKTYKTSLTKQEAKERLLNAKFEVSAFDYEFEEIEDSVFVANPKKEYSLYYNSFVPQITVTLSDYDIRVEFTLMKIIKYFLIFINADALFIGLYLLASMLFIGVLKWQILIPIGVLLVALLLPALALRAQSKWAENEIDKIIK